MKINKRFSIFIVLIFMLLVSLSAVSANDIAANETVDSCNDRILSLDIENSDLESINNNDSVLSASPTVNPIYIFENGVVSGGVDIVSVNPWKEYGSLEYTIPDNVKEIKFAMVIVNSYSGSGNSDNYALHSEVTLTTDSTKTIGSENLTYSGNQAGDPTVYVINDHTTKQYSDYQYTYDILSDISNLTSGSTIKISVTNSKYGSKAFDGRIKLIGLFIAYDDEDLDKITYWLNVGQVWSQDSSSISINPSPLTV